MRGRLLGALWFDGRGAGDSSDLGAAALSAPATAFGGAVLRMKYPGDVT